MRPLVLLLPLLLAACPAPGAFFGPGTGPAGGPGGPEPALGRAAYEGKPLLGTPGEFTRLAVAADGSQAAFVVREDTGRQRICVAPVDGAVRALDAVGQTPEGLAFTADGGLLYLTRDASPRPAFTLHRIDLATGADRVVAPLPSFGMAYPAPAGDAVLLWGYDPGFTKVSATLDRLDVATGGRRRLLDACPPPADVAWAPDGRAFAIAHHAEGPNEPAIVRTFAAPGWDAPQTFPGAADGATAAGGHWWEPGDVLARARRTGGGALALEVLSAAGPAPAFLTLPAPEAAPVDFGAVLPDAGRTRFLLAAPPRAWLATRATGAAAALPAGRQPLAWLGAARYLAADGASPARTLVAVEVPAD